jgi:putative FmdB family regulatory protein
MGTMPKYDYYCQNHCAGVLEYVLPFDHEIPKCGICGNEMDRIYSPTPAIFKGKGWGSKP